MRVINLLPKPKQKELQYDGILHSLVIVIWITLASFAVVLLVQFGTKLYLGAKVSSVDQQISSLNAAVSKQDNAALKTQIKTINNLLTDYTSLAAASPKWSNVIKAFAPLPPPDIQITSFVGSIGDKTVTISGFSPTRDLVIQLYNIILNDTKDFSNIDYPLENVAKPTDVQFHFTFNVRDELLQ